MKAPKQKAGRTPQSPQSKIVKWTVDLPADHWLLKLPPEERNAAANRAMRVFLAQGWAASPRRL